MLHPPYKFLLFGSLAVEDAQGQRETRFRTRRAASLAAYLAFRTGQGPLRRAELAEQFWPDLPDEGQRNSLSIALSALRLLLEPKGVVTPGAIVVADRNTVMLAAECITVDVSRFELLVSPLQRPLANRPATTGEKENALREAIALYRGPVLTSFDDPWILSEREHQAARFSWVVRHLCQLLAATAETAETSAALFQEAVNIARLGIEREPGREELQVELVRRLVAAGDRSEARHHYTHLVEMLEALGDDPPSDLADAFRMDAAPASPKVGRSRRSKSAELSFHSPALQSAAAWSRSFLPPATTEFVGRRRERMTLAGLLGQEKNRPNFSSLVTLTGPGGMGKTRLALEVARDLANSQVTVFVPLATVTAPEQIAPLLHECLASQARKALGTRAVIGDTPATPGAALEQASALLCELYPRGTLLVLDNLEQVAAATAETVHFLLEAVPGLCILATSRQALGLSAEKEFPVEPLGLPPLPLDKDTLGGSDPAADAPLPEEFREGDAVRLFVRRVQAVRPDFRLTSRNAAIVAALVNRLEGIPLAIELATAQAGTLSPARMLERMEERLDFLAVRDGFRGFIGVAQRHHSLRAVIGGSLDFLPPSLRHFWSGLSVFRGGFTAEAAAAVVGTGHEAGEEMGLEDTEEALERLRQASLVIVQEDETDTGATRFTLLETLREYGAELTAREAGTREGSLGERHARYFLSLAERVAPLLYGSEQRYWLARLRSDHVNLHTALYFLTDTARPEEALRLAAALGRYWCVAIGVAEPHNWFTGSKAQAFLQDRSVPDSVRGRAWAVFACVTGLWTHYEASTEHWRTAISLLREAGDTRGLADALAYQFGEQALLEEGAGLAEAEGMDYALCAALLNLGIQAGHGGDDEKAEERFTRSLDVAVRSGNAIGELGVRCEWAYFLSARCRYNRAVPLLEAAIANYTQSGPGGHVLSHARWLLGNALVHQGSYAAGLSLLEAALLERRQGSRHALCDTLRSVGLAHHYMGDIRGARVALEESRQIGLALGSSFAAHADVMLGRIAADEGDFPAARVWLVSALSEAEMGRDRWCTAAAEREAGRTTLLMGTQGGRVWPAPDAAREAMAPVMRSLRSRREMLLPRLVLESMETLAGVFAAWGTADAAWEALRLLEGCRRERERLGVPLPPPDQPFAAAVSAHARFAAGSSLSEKIIFDRNSLADHALATAERLSSEEAGACSQSKH